MRRWAILTLVATSSWYASWDGLYYCWWVLDSIEVCVQSKALPPRPESSTRQLFRA